MLHVTVVGGFAYAAVVLDAWSRRVVGYAISRSIDARLTLAALTAAVVGRNRHPAACIILIADRRADSIGPRHRLDPTIYQDLVERFGGSFPSERLAGSGIECMRDRIQFLSTVLAEIGAFREVLSQQAVRVLVCAALPRALRIAKVNLKASVDLQPGMLGRLLQSIRNWTIELDGEVLEANVRNRTREQRRRIQLVPQDSLDALNPRRSVAETLARPLQLFRDLKPQEVAFEINQLLELVRLSPDIAARYPATRTSTRKCCAGVGGKAANYRLRRNNLGTRCVGSGVYSMTAWRSEARTLVSVLFITHDLGAVAEIADDVLVQDSGRVAEWRTTFRVLADPASGYTRDLLDAAPRLSLERPGWNITKSFN